MLGMLPPSPHPSTSPVLNAHPTAATVPVPGGRGAGALWPEGQSSTPSLALDDPSGVRDQMALSLSSCLISIRCTPLLSLEPGLSLRPPPTQLLLSAHHSPCPPGILEPPLEGTCAPLSPQVKRTLFINGISKYAESEKIKKHFE